jgi:predicted transcriptional regulator
MTRELDAALIAYARQNGRTRSAIVRKAVRELLKAEGALKEAI